MPGWFPSIVDSYSKVEETSTRPSIKAKFESGYTQTRSKYTISKKTFKLTWKNMPDASMTTLTTFYEDTTLSGASSFQWASPTGNTHVCFFDEDTLKFSSTRKGYWDVSIAFTEV